MRVWSFAVAPLALVACASGTTDVDDLGGEVPIFTGAGSGGSDVGSGGGASTTTASVGVGGAGVGGMGGGGMDSSGGAGGMPPTCDLVTPDTTCQGAFTLGAVSGDEGGSKSTTGIGSTWLKIHVQETSSSIIEADLSYTVTLQSPVGVDYDLYVYQGPQDGNLDCNTSAVQGMPTTGTLETVSAGWDDDQGIGGEDDSVWLAIEIVHVSGVDCDAEWTLTVRGDP